MTEVIYLEVENKYEDFKWKHRVSVSGMLRVLGVSRLGYNLWLHRLPSNQQKRKVSVKRRIKKIYEQSYEKYGAPKTQKKYRKMVKKYHNEQLENTRKSLE